MKRIILTWLALCAALFGAWQLSALDVPLFKSAHIERLLVTPAHAQLSMTGAGAGAPSSGGGSPSYNAAVTSDNNSAMTDFTTLDVSLGSGSFCILTLGTYTGATVSGVTVNGSSLTQIDEDTSGPLYLFAGNCTPTGSDAVVVTTTSVPDEVVIAVWVAKNLNSTTAISHANNNGSTISSAASVGNFVFVTNAQAYNYTSSSQTPPAHQGTIGTGQINGYADWTASSAGISGGNFTATAAGFSYQVIGVWH